MNEVEERALLFDVLRITESVPELVGLGPHLLATASKPEASVPAPSA